MFRSGEMFGVSVTTGVRLPDIQQATANKTFVGSAYKGFVSPSRLAHKLESNQPGFIIEKGKRCLFSSTIDVTAKYS